ncbi:MAG: carcinine hydrolase/isopenicillin-N N-acyltransferase family protein [Chloroflexota bacterium]
MLRKTYFHLILLAVLMASCGRAAPATIQAPAVQTSTPVAIQPTAQPIPTATGKPETDEEATLASLQKVGDYPLYTMHYVGDYGARLAANENIASRSLAAAPGWACSLFAALGDPASRLYGRNFDWQYSPALLLFTDPPDGYASVSMVDIAYLVQPGQVSRLDELPLAERRALLDAPAWPFDGMNEHGLAVGMAAVPPGSLPPDPAKETVGSLGVIREMLDHAKDVDEAVAILQEHNIDFEGGPPLHYLIADHAGRAMLVEFYQGKLYVFPNESPWHEATNFLLAGAGASPQGNCWRYDRLNQQLSEAGGALAAQQAMQLLSQVAQDGTQWSVIYGISTGSVTVVMGREYDEAYTLTGIWEP